MMCLRLLAGLLALGLSVAAKLVPRLSSQTLWRLQLQLQDPETGVKFDAQARVRFIDEPGYEPPSGKLFVDSDLLGIIRVDDRGFACSWCLSEDKNDKKDGLWIWGLFSEPKFPYLYFNLNLFDTFVSESTGEEEKLPVEVPGSRLLVRFDHEFSAETGVSLTRPTMSFKATAFAKADPLGLGGEINVGEEVRAGTITLTPVNEEVEKLGLPSDKN